MSLSASITPSTVNLLRNVTGDWGADFTKVSDYKAALVEQGMDDAFHPPLFHKTPEERQREIADIMRQREYFEAEKERKRQQTDFMRHLEEVRPVLRTEEVNTDIEQRARELTTSLMEIFKNGVAVSMSIGYCSKILSQDMGLDVNSSNFPRKRILSSAKDIATVPLIATLCDFFGLDPRHKEALMEREVGKLYSPEPKPRGDRPAHTTSPERHSGPLMGDGYHPPQTRSNPFSGNSKPYERRYPKDGRNSGLEEGILSLLQSAFPK